MNIKNIDLKDLFKKRNKAFAPETEDSGADFARDWKIISIFFAAGMVIISAFSWQIYLSDKIGGGYVVSTLEPIDVSVKTIDKKRLQADILILQTRQSDFQKYKANSPRVVDPAL